MLRAWPPTFSLIYTISHGMSFTQTRPSRSLNIPCNAWWKSRRAPTSCIPVSTRANGCKINGTCSDGPKIFTHSKSEADRSRSGYTTRLTWYLPIYPFVRVEINVVGIQPRLPTIRPRRQVRQRHDENGCDRQYGVSSGNICIGMLQRWSFMDYLGC